MIRLFITKRENYYEELEDSKWFLNDKVLFNGKYIMERAVAIKNLNNPFPIYWWGLRCFHYNVRGLDRFDASCAVSYNLYAKIIHRRVLKNLEIK